MDSLRELYRSESDYQNAIQRYDNTLKQWQISPQSLYVETRFGQTHILQVGDISNPPFIFFHGWNGNAAGTYFEVDISRLAQYFCLYFPDTIGQSGKSAPCRPSTADSSYGEWASDIFTALAFDKVYVSGISGGGYLALKACAYNLDKVNKAFVMSSGGLVDLSRINLRFILSVLPAALGFKWGGRYFMRRMVSPNFEDETILRQAGEGMRDTLSGIKPVNGPKPLSDAELRAIQCPVMIVMGRHDIAVAPRQTIERAELLIPTVKTQLIDAGHMMTLETRDWLMDEMLKFFDIE